MAHHITVLPASSRAGREAILTLLNAKESPPVHGIYRDPAKAPLEFIQNPRFQAVKGDVASDGELNLDKSSAVFYVPPITYDGTEQGEFATKATLKLAKALEKAEVKRLVLHSVIGAQHSHGTGVIKLNHISDEILKYSAPEVVIVKPAWYFEMWAPVLHAVEDEKTEIEIPFSPPEYAFPQVSVRDVGDFCAKALLGDAPVSSPYIVDIVGPRDYSSLDIKEAVERLSGKKVSLTTVAKEGLAAYWTKEGVPKEHVPEFVDFVAAMHPGGVLAGHSSLGKHIVRGKLELVDVLGGMSLRKTTV